MRICFILKAYFPSVSPSGLLIKKLAEELVKEHEVHIFCRDLNENDNIREDIHNGVIISRYECYYSSNIFISKVWKTVSFSFYKKKTINDIVKSVEKYLSKINFDVIIPVTYEEIISCSKLLNKYDNIYPFLLEKLFNKNYYGKFDFFFKIRETKNVRALKLYMNKNSIFFCLPIVKKYIIDSISSNKVNICVLEHPTVVVKDNKRVVPIRNTDEISINYIGALDMKIRNPKPFLEYLLPIIPLNYKVNFYGYGNCNSLLTTYEGKYSNFKFGGKIDPETSADIMEKSDFLITFGNSTPDIVSSKIFECISTQNPIIHFYQYDRDPYINYLKKYPLSLCIPLNELNNTKYQNSIIQFIQDNLYKKVSKKLIQKNFYEFTPKYVGDMIIDCIEKQIISERKI